MNDKKQKLMKMISEVDELRRSGVSAGSACKTVKIPYSTYGYYKYQKKSSSDGAVTFSDLSENKPARKYEKKNKNQKIAVIIGSAKDVLGAINEYL
jgi:hypothetical protein